MSFNNRCPTCRVKIQFPKEVEKKRTEQEDKLKEMENRMEGILKEITRREEENLNGEGGQQEALPQVEKDVDLLIHQNSKAENNEAIENTKNAEKTPEMIKDEESPRI